MMKPDANLMEVDAERDERGCGYRVEDGLYLTIGRGFFGQPIEFFLVDPATAWNGGQLRAPMLIEDSEKTIHILLGIGKSYYPFVPDFVEEARRLGITKRVPRNFEVERLTPGKSKLFLIHPRAIPNFVYEADCTCPKHNKMEHECVGFLWSLSGLKDFGEHHKLLKNGNFGTILVKTPSCSYEITKPKKPEGFQDHYSSGIILATGICKFEYVNRRGKVPTELKNRIEKAKFRLEVVPK